jgi:hypothetical protein
MEAAGFSGELDGVHIGDEITELVRYREDALPAILAFDRHA